MLFRSRQNGTGATDKGRCEQAAGGLLRISLPGIRRCARNDELFRHGGLAPARDPELRRPVERAEPPFRSRLGENGTGHRDELRTFRQDGSEGSVMVGAPNCQRADRDGRSGVTEGWFRRLALRHASFSKYQQEGAPGRRRAECTRSILHSYLPVPTVSAVVARALAPSYTGDCRVDQPQTRAGKE